MFRALLCCPSPPAPSSLAGVGPRRSSCLRQPLTRSSSSSSTFPQHTCVLKRRTDSDKARTVWYGGLLDALRRPSHQSRRSPIRPPECIVSSSRWRSCCTVAGQQRPERSERCLPSVSSAFREKRKMSPQRLAGCRLVPSLAHSGTGGKEADQHRGYHAGGISRLFCSEFPWHSHGISVLLNKVWAERSRKGQKDFSLSRKFPLALQGLEVAVDVAVKRGNNRSQSALTVVLMWLFKELLHPGSLIFPSLKPCY